MRFSQWLKEWNAEPGRGVEACFTDGQALLEAGNFPEALRAFSRVLQLAPNHEQALMRRERLAMELGLEELDRAARTLEQFAYSHCGPGERWKVELREMHAFRPNQTPETYNAALLDLCQVPPAFIELTIRGRQYAVRVMADRQVPGVSRTCLSEVRSECVPTRADALLELLEQFVETGLLVTDGRRLQYVGTKA